MTLLSRGSCDDVLVEGCHGRSNRGPSAVALRHRTPDPNRTFRSRAEYLRQALPRGVRGL